MSFRNPVDIANRGLQHCGATRISNTYGFTEDSVQAAECAFVYDKLRRAELRRNVWRFAIRKAVLRALDVNTRTISPPLWSSGSTYFQGAMVTTTDGTIWISTIPDNLNHTPGNSYAWDSYFGPVSVSLYDSTTTYFAGEVVYKTPGDGTYTVFVSLANDNADNPATATTWSATDTYVKDNIVSYNSVLYLSMIDFNTGQTPTSSKAAWSSATTYSTGNAVYGSDGFIYTSVGNGNLANDPTTDLGVHWTNTGVLNVWTTSFTGGTGSAKWLRLLNTVLYPAAFTYPVGTGPSTQAATRNVFMLPAGFLRVAPQDPKAGSTSFLGSESGLQYSDWNLEGSLIVSRDATPIVLRFVADIVNVPGMDDMFCEGLAARIGYEVAPKVTQSADKQATIAKAYEKFMGDARTVNGIETGPTEAPVDDYIACRV